jgi:hypothetical protein
MSEQRDTSADVSRLFVPEREFWVPEIADQYLDDDGRPKQTRSGENDFQKIPVPLIDPENYPVVDIPTLAENLRSMFKPGYRFPRYYIKNVTDRHGNQKEIILHNRDNIDHVQSQYLYQAKNHDNDKSLMDFCNDPERKWRLPWIEHNVKTIFFDDPEIPDGWIRTSHLLAVHLCTNALQSATNTIRANKGVRMRIEAVKRGIQIPSDEEDRDGKKFVLDRRIKEHQNYLRDIENLRFIPLITPYAHVAEDLADAKPIDAIRVLSKIATLESCWDYSNYMRHGSASTASRNPRRNPAIRKALTVAIGRAAANKNPALV